MRLRPRAVGAAAQVVDGVEAKAERRRIGAADDDRARALPVGDGRAVGWRDQVAKGDDAVGRRAAFLVDVFLDRHRNAVQRPERRVRRGDRAIGAIRGGARRLGQIDGDRVELAVDRRHARERTPRPLRAPKSRGCGSPPRCALRSSARWLHSSMSPKAARARGLRASANPANLARQRATLHGRNDERHRRRRFPARDQHLRAVEGGLRRVRARRRLAAADLRRRDRAAPCRRQHSRRRRDRRAARPRAPHGRTRLGRRVAVGARHARRLRAHRRRHASTPRCGGPGRRRLPRPARRDGHRAPRRRRRRVARARARHRRTARADRRQPRPARQRHARDDRALRRPGRLPHLSARRHGGDRRARGAAARPRRLRAGRAGRQDRFARSIS